MRKPIYFYKRNGTGWFRVFNGPGLYWKDISRHGETFSERNGFTKYAFRIGTWRFYFLK